MSGRTPSFIVVGLVIIMFLLGVFYMSCSSKNTELRTSLDQFEERIRSLTLKNSDADKKYENLLTRQRELEEEKLTIQKQMEKKDSEINDLNTKLNEKLAELQSLNSDKKVADEQIKEYKSQSDTLASKNSLIEKLQQELNEQKETLQQEIDRLKKESETSKVNSAAQGNQAPAANEPNNSFVIPPQRYRPLEANNFTTRSIASLFQDPTSNLTKEVKAQMVAAAYDTKDKVLNAFGINKETTTTIGNQEQQQQQDGQNVPKPPLADNAQQQEQQQQQGDHAEGAQNAPQHDDDQQVAAADNVQQQKNLLSDNKNDKLSNVEELDDEEQINPDTNVRKHNFGDNHPSYRGSKQRNYRIGNRNNFGQRQRFDNEGELDEGENRDDYRLIRKRNTA